MIRQLDPIRQMEVVAERSGVLDKWDEYTSGRKRCSKRHTHTPILLAAGSDLWNAAGLDYDVLRSVCSVLPDSRLTAIDLAAASWVHIGRVPLRSLTITHLEDLCAHLQATTHEPGGVWSQA